MKPKNSRALWNRATDEEKKSLADQFWHASSRPQNGLERRFGLLVAGSNLEYVGNNQIWINGHCPDFIHWAKKKIVEVYGDYWHSKPKAKRRDIKRLIGYTKAGYATLVVWEHDITSKPEEIKKSVFAFLARP